MTGRPRGTEGDGGSPLADVNWLLGGGASEVDKEGLVSVEGYIPQARPAKEAVIMEKAAAYGAHSVFFEVSPDGGNGSPQAFIFEGSQGAEADKQFAEVHQRLWSWGGVPLIYRRLPDAVQIFRCAHLSPVSTYGTDLRL